MFFCERCGSPLFYEQQQQQQQQRRERDPERDEGQDQLQKQQLQHDEDDNAEERVYGVFTGVLGLEPVPESELELELAPDDPSYNTVRRGIIRITEHIFVGDTLDGGVASWMRGPEVKIWLGKREESREVGGLERWPAEGVNADRNEGEHTNGNSDAGEGSEWGSMEVPVICHCGGVDLMFWTEKIRLGTAAKGFVAFDGCESCRRAAGVDMMYWVVTRLGHLGWKGEDGKKFPRTTSALRSAVDRNDGNMGTLRCYASSASVQRYFCGRCSATVFLAADEDEEVMRVALGLLKTPDGARAEGFVSWYYDRGLLHL